MRDRTLLAVLSAFTLTVCLMLLSSWACVRILSGVRAYVGGEGLYSKAQKNAVYFLELYLRTRDEQWFAKFDQALRVPEGDRDARLELQRPHPDFTAVTRAFVAGGNSPDDVDDLVFVFRRLGRTPYVSTAIGIWTDADREIARLRSLGEQIHSQLPAASEPLAFISTSALRIETLNRRLTILEDQFSYTLGAGARFTATALLTAIGILAALLWLTGALTLRRLLVALAGEREDLRAIIDSAPLGIVLVDAPAGRIRLRNAQTLLLLGGAQTAWTKSEYASARQARGEDGQPLAWPDFPVAKALRGELVQACSLEWTRPDGSAIWLRVSAAPIRRGGAVVGAVAVFSDISEERKIAEALVRQSGELARSNADLEQFAYTTSHDLREPLRNIAVFSELLSSAYAGRLNRDADYIVAVIISSVDRMTTLIHDLLAYSRVNNMDAAPMNLIDLNRAVEWACGNLRSKILESHAVIEAAPLPALRCDQVQIVQVFQNLIENAIKYASPGEAPSIRIAAEKLDGEWRITVKDNGVGVEPQYRQQIFAIFKRLHGRDIPGTGIGLALAKRVVERHGGTISVEANHPRGSTFLFTLPDAAAAEEGQANVESRVAS